MNIVSQSNTVSQILGRYFVTSKKLILHFGDCEIYKADRPFCGCGLLHDLQHVDYTLAKIIFPKYDDDLYIQETGERKKKRRNKKKEAEAKAFLESVFGKIEPPSLADIKWEYDDMSKILDKTCTPTSFPSAFKNLKKWLRKEVSRENN